MFLRQGEIPKGDIVDIGLKGLKLKNMKFCSLFCQKTSKSVSQLHVFTLKKVDYNNLVYILVIKQNNFKVP